MSPSCVERMPFVVTQRLGYSHGDHRLSHPPPSSNALPELVQCWQPLLLPDTAAALPPPGSGCWRRTTTSIKGIQPALEVSYGISQAQLVQKYSWCCKFRIGHKFQTETIFGDMEVILESCSRETCIHLDLWSHYILAFQIEPRKN